MDKFVCVLCVCELFSETIRNMFGCACYFVVKCDGVVKDNKNRTLKCVNCGQGHTATSRLCPKKLEAENKANTSHTSALKYLQSDKSTETQPPFQRKNGPFHLKKHQLHKPPPSRNQ